MTLASTKPRLVVLGTPRLRAGSGVKEEKTLIGAGKPLAVVALLALSPRRTISRDHLCDFLWGDRDLDQARAQLRQTLWLIKGYKLPFDVAASAEGIALDGSLSVDALEFAEAATSNRLNEALDLYGGDFFQNYGAPGAQRFEEWADLERTRFRSLFTHSAESLVRRALDAGRFPEAIRISRRIRHLDPNGETAWRLLLESIASSGDVIGARAEADHFEAWLRQEQREPEPLSIAILKSARRATETQPETAPDLVADLTGRDREFAALHRAWTEAQSRGARLVHLVAESGLGKTRLVTDFAARLRVQRARVSYQHANTGERSIPLSFAAGIASSLAQLPGAAGVSQGTASTLLTLNPSLSSVFVNAAPARDLQPRQVGFALLELISAVTDEAPLALLLDDLHWADAQSQEVIALIVSRLEQQRALIVTCARPRQVVPSLPDHALRLHLSPLDASEVEQFIASLGTLPAEPWARSFCDAARDSSGGSPLYLLEAIRLCIERGVIQRREGAWECPNPAAMLALLSQTSVVGRRLHDLSDTEKRLLYALAIAAVPLPSRIATQSAQLGDAEAAVIATTLEQRGFLIADGGYWRMAHDEIADAVIDADGGEAPTMHAVVAAAMAASPEPDWRRRAIPHLGKAGSWPAAAQLAANILRTSGTLHPSDDDIRALLGVDATAEHMSLVRRHLPFGARHPRFRAAMLAAAATVAIVGTAVANAALRPDIEGPMLAVATRGAGDAARVRLVSLNASDWVPAQPLLVPREGEKWFRFSAFLGHMVPRPGRDEWAIEAVYPDSGSGDIELTGRQGSAVRITASRGQDVPQAFSPDAAQLLFMSTRWSDRGFWNLGILTLATGDVRRLTASPYADGSGSWHPDGTIIGFTRSDPERDVSLVCVIDVSGENERCREIGYWRIVGFAGWTRTGMLVQGDSAGVKALFLVSRSLAIREVSRGLHPGNLETDPSGRWVLEGGVERNGRVTWRVAPADRLDLFREIVLEDTSVVNIEFASRQATPWYLDHLIIDSLAEAVPLDVPYRLRASGLAPDGSSVPPEQIRWTVSGVGATIDTLGVLLARDTGTFVVRASAGGWRTATRTVRVVTQVDGTLLDEVWRDPVFARWTAFGEPSPAIVDGDRGRAFLNQGEGTFFSGAYLTRTVDARQGLALDVDLSTPITRFQWQVIIIGMSAIDSTTLRLWDHRTGYLPGLVRGGCHVTYPVGEGAGADNKIGYIYDLAAALNDPSLRINDGRWWRMRLQLFPDGRCGLAINGRPLYVASSPDAAPTSVHPIVQGSTAGTRMLVGRVTIRKGVPADIDWSTMQPFQDHWRPRTARPSPALTQLPHRRIQEP